MLGRNLISLTSMIFCFLRASFFFFCSSYLNLPKSRILQTGGSALGATSTRSRPASAAISSASLRATTDDQHQRHLGEAVLAHLVIDRLVAGIGNHPEPGTGQFAGDRLGVGRGLADDRGDDRLHRRQPQREMPGVMLDQDADETLH